MNSFDCCYHAISDISAGPDLMKNGKLPAYMYT